MCLKYHGICLWKFSEEMYMQVCIHTQCLFFKELWKILLQLHCQLFETYGERQKPGVLQAWRVQYWKMEDMQCHSVRRTGLAGNSCCCFNCPLPAGVAMVQEQSLRVSTHNTKCKMTGQNRNSFSEWHSYFSCYTSDKASCK